MNDDVEARLQKLEEIIAHQAQTIDELSDELARQGLELDRARARLEAMATRFQAIEEQGVEAPPITRPPHY